VGAGEQIDPRVGRISRGRIFLKQAFHLQRLVHELSALKPLDFEY
jgi:hypothetical protein